MAMEAIATITRETIKIISKDIKVETRQDMEIRGDQIKVFKINSEIKEINSMEEISSKIEIIINTDSKITKTINIRPRIRIGIGKDNSINKQEL